MGDSAHTAPRTEQCYELWYFCLSLGKTGGGYVHARRHFLLVIRLWSRPSKLCRCAETPLCTLIHAFVFRPKREQLIDVQELCQRLSVALSQVCMGLPGVCGQGSTPQTRLIPMFVHIFCPPPTRRFTNTSFAAPRSTLSKKCGHERTATNCGTPAQ